MDSKYQEEYIACFIIFGLLIAFSVFMLKQYFYTSEKPLEVIHATILFWTGIIVLIYTRETYKLREAAHKQIEVAQKQTEIQQRPFVITDIIRSAPNQYPQIAVKNIGNWTAINIRIKDAKAEHEIYSMIYCFPKVVPTLSCGEQPVVVLYESEMYKEGKRVSSGLIPTDLFPWSATTSTTIKLEFANIEGQLYFVEERIAQESFEIVGFGRVSSDVSGQ